MPSGFQSVLLLTILLAIGLVFFLRAASKDRTTVVISLHRNLHWPFWKDSATGWNNAAGAAMAAMQNDRFCAFKDRWPQANPSPFCYPFLAPSAQPASD